MFRRLLIPNRGEIAARVIRACHTLGVEAIVAHSEVDRGAPWLEDADGTVCIGPAPSERSYLNAAAILQAAEQTGCQAIHPGYGFLSENAVFAARCAQQGLVFVGPRPDAIRRMGRKTEAKRTVHGVGLRTVPGKMATAPDVERAAAAAREVGYPVLLKATAGGGGRGLRACADEVELRRAFREASLEARSTFGDAGLYVEALMEGCRHVEFQVLCDAWGHGVHLGERECSIQRHRQKLVEEAPAPRFGETRRRRVGEAVARAVTDIGYVSAGSVEFLLAPDDHLYFMEMNTRLQVEHPVTELVTGIDLVVEQLRIAAGAPLGHDQADIVAEGHAIELRVNAEDPGADFRPDPGTVTAFEPPASGVPGVTIRWDSALRAGYRVPAWYDSLVGKLVVHGPDRKTALAGAREALGTLRIEGVATTLDLLRRIVDHPDFVAGDYRLDFLESNGLVRAPGGGGMPWPR